jgi:hypothetical protein
MKTEVSSPSGGGVPDAMIVHAVNVTGSQEIPIEVGPSLSVRSVTDAIAHRMALPTDVAWSLRDDRSSAYLDDEGAIGDQIAPGSRVVITPKSHLGGGLLG